jgi:hypothetical protein
MNSTGIQHDPDSSTSLLIWNSPLMTMKIMDPKTPGFNARKEKTYLNFHWEIFPVLGYSEPAAFIRKFKKPHGDSPLQLRKTHR